MDEYIYIASGCPEQLETVLQAVGDRSRCVAGAIERFPASLGMRAPRWACRDHLSRSYKTLASAAASQVEQWFPMPFHLYLVCPYWSA